MPVSSFKVDVTEVRLLSKNLDYKRQDVATKARAVVKLMAFQLQRQAKVNAPVDTGALMNSISVTFKGNGYVSSAVVAPTVDYASYVEEGTSRMAPQPYMGPAADVIEPVFVAAMEKLIEGL